MNKNINASVFLVCLLLMISCWSNVYAFTRSYNTYRIDRAWFDKDCIYVTYYKSAKNIEYSLFNLNGTIIRESSQKYILKINKLDIGKNKFALNGEKVPESFVYADANISINKSKSGISVINRSSSIKSLPCNERFWSRDLPIRSRDNVMYCGYLIDKYGEIIWKIPDVVVQTLEEVASSQLAGRRFLTEIPFRLTSVFMNDHISMIWADPIFGTSEMNLAKVQIDNTNNIKWTKVSLPVSSNGYLIQNGVDVYSPTGSFVLKKRLSDEKEVLLCNENSFRKISLPFQYTYILNDPSVGKLYVIDHESFTSSYVNLVDINY